MNQYQIDSSLETSFIYFCTKREDMREHYSKQRTDKTIVLLYRYILNEGRCVLFTTYSHSEPIPKRFFRSTATAAGVSNNPSFKSGPSDW